jgi:small-conductance mechanosensitive channel
VNGISDQPWFWWALAVVIGVPIVLLVLTEVYDGLVRRRSPLARPVGLLRNLLVPVGALLALLTLVAKNSTDEPWVKIIATIFGFLILVFVLAGLNAALFGSARQGTWRERMPSIFVDLIRVVLIVIGLGILFSWVWGSDVGGLFAALGVTSIVLGLALQNAVGSIISGLLLLFEQPFALGDWLDTGDVRGRVVQVNWRAVHIDTGNGIQIVPNASLAGASFTNLSEPPGAHAVTLNTKFIVDDPPGAVCTLLEQVALEVPQLLPGAMPRAAATGPATYAVTLPVGSPALADGATGDFLRRLWYAARRAGLHLDGANLDGYSPPEQIEQATARLATTLNLQPTDVPALAGVARLEQYGDGEVLALYGRVPDRLTYVVEGRVTLLVPVADGAQVPFAHLGPGDAVGLTVLTREPGVATAVAVGTVAVLQVPVDTIDTLVQNRPNLARDLGSAIDMRRQAAERARADAERPFHADPASKYADPASIHADPASASLPPAPAR